MQSKKAVAANASAQATANRKANGRTAYGSEHQQGVSNQNGSQSYAMAMLLY